MTVDPSWTLEEAQAEQKKWTSVNPEKESDPASPLFQWFALHRLEICRTEFEGGDKFQLMTAIKECAVHELIMPDWVTRAYLKGFYGVANARIGSWDKEFGKPYPKSTNINSVRKKRFVVPLLRRKITELRERGVPIGQELFELAAQELNEDELIRDSKYWVTASYVRDNYKEKKQNDSEDE